MAGFEPALVLMGGYHVTQWATKPPPHQFIYSTQRAISEPSPTHFNENYFKTKTKSTKSFQDESKIKKKFSSNIKNLDEKNLAEFSNRRGV